MKMFSIISLRRGATMIELMVVCSIVVLVAVSMSLGLMKLLAIEDETRDKAFIRERLCRMIAEYANCISMAKAISNDTNYIEFRTETGGISLETNFMCKVTSVSLALTNLYYSSALSDGIATGVGLTIVTEDEKYGGKPRQLVLDSEAEIYQNFRSAIKRERGNQGDVCFLKIEGSGSVRRLILRAKYPSWSKTADGNRMAEDEEIEVSRVVRLWNYQ